MSDATHTKLHFAFDNLIIIQTRRGRSVSKTNNLPPDSNAGLRKRFGAHTIARFRSVIPVLSAYRDILFKCDDKYFKVLKKKLFHKF